ncbi:hypothetical protein GpartN1_g3453.t1 [Galdieria partita]|uniref:Uncharacterized protein n=1 Tax=Galdieria partita TaxID=83374 RepID=A0A9C7UQM3_9RHOD|nr:hypothetical protein GpartN1_g3453.t1 [Galdieria partita]
MHEDTDSCSRKELNHFELKALEAFFLRNVTENLHLFHPRELFLQGNNDDVRFFLAENFSSRVVLSSRSGLLLIPRIQYYALAMQSYDKDHLKGVLHLFYLSDVEKRALSAYGFRYCWSKDTFIVNSTFQTLVTISMEDKSNLVKLCSIDSLFYWVRQSGEDICSRLFLLLEYVIPNLLIRQPIVIRYFILKHLSKFVDIFVAIPMKRQPLALHRSFLIVSLKGCNDPCCLVRQLGLELLERLLYRPCFLVLQSFSRKNIKAEIYSSISNAIVTSQCDWDHLHSLLQKLKLGNSKGLVALEVSGSLIQLAEDSCLHIRLSFVRVIDVLLHYHKTNTRLTRHVVDCLLSLLYDASDLIRTRTLNVLTNHAPDLCLDDMSLRKLLVCLLDPNSLFRYSVVFFLSNIMLSEDCNLSLVFKYYMNALEFFHDDLPILLWSIERLGIRNPHLIRKNVLNFPQLVNNFFRKWNVVDQFERNILYVSEQHKLQLIFKFFLSSNDEQVIERLPRSFVLLFDIRKRKYEEYRLSSYLQSYCRNEENLMRHSTLQSVLSCLSFELAFFGYRCLYYEYNCFSPVYLPLLKLYIHLLENMSCNLSLEPIVHTAKYLLEWLRLWPISSKDASCHVPEYLTIEFVKESESAMDCKNIWRNALLDTIIELELFQSPYKGIEQLCKVLEHIYEEEFVSHLASDFYKAVEHYFIYSHFHLRTIRYYFQIISLTCSENIEGSNTFLLELQCAVSVQNFELDRIPQLFIRIYSRDNTKHALTMQQRLESCEQHLREGRTLFSEACLVRLEANDYSGRDALVSLETILYDKIVSLAPLQPIQW